MTRNQIWDVQMAVWTKVYLIPPCLASVVYKFNLRLITNKLFDIILYQIQLIRRELNFRGHRSDRGKYDHDYGIPQVLQKQVHVRCTFCIINAFSFHGLRQLSNSIRCIPQFELSPSS